MLPGKGLCEGQTSMIFFRAAWELVVAVRLERLTDNADSGLTLSMAPVVKSNADVRNCANNKLASMLSVTSSHLRPEYSSGRTEYAWGHTPLLKSFPRKAGTGRLHKYTAQKNRAPNQTRSASQYRTGVVHRSSQSDSASIAVRERVKCFS